MAAQDDICRLNELPESILSSNIISRLTLYDAVRSSILCRKWRFLWTKIPHLHFSPDFFSYLFYREEEDGINFGETIEHILMRHDASLESFDIHISSLSHYSTFGNDLEKIDIEQCIHHAAKKGVKKVLLKVDADLRGMKMDIPVTVFGCNALLYLELSRFVIPEIPKLTPSENFAFLKTCCLRNIENLTDKTLQGLLELCPVLQKLVLISCKELIDLKVQAANLNCLILLGCSCVQSLIADCPQLCQVKIGSNSSLAEVQINSYNPFELKVWDCYILCKMQINSCLFLQEVGSLEALSIEGHPSISSIGSLRKLSLLRCPSSRFLGSPILSFSSSGFNGFSCPLTLVGIFPDLEELKVFASMMGTAAVREEKMEVISDFMFPNLKKASLYMSSHRSEEDVAVLGFVLRNSPSLNTLTVNRPYCFEDSDELEFKNLLLSLKRASEEVEIKVMNEDDEEDKEEYYVEPEDDPQFWNDLDDYEESALHRFWDDYEEEDYDDFTRPGLLLDGEPDEDYSFLMALLLDDEPDDDDYDYRGNPWDF